MDLRLLRLSSVLDDLIEFGDKPKTRYQAIKPYLAGHEVYGTQSGLEAARAVSVKKKIPIHVSSTINPAISDKPIRSATPLIKPDLRRKDWSAKNIRTDDGTLISKSDQFYKDSMAHFRKTFDPVTRKGQALPIPESAGALHFNPEENPLHGEAHIASGKDLTRPTLLYRDIKKRTLPIGDKRKDEQFLRGEMKSVGSHVAQAGLEGRAIVRSRNILTGSKLEHSKIPEFLTKTREDLRTMVKSHIAKSTEAHSSLLAETEGKVSSAIKDQAAKEGKNLEPEQLAHKTKSRMAVLGAATHHELEPEKHYADLASLIGNDHPEPVKHVQELHKKLTDLKAEASPGAQALKRQELIKSGHLFNPDMVDSAYKHIKGATKARVRTDLKSSPTLRKYGAAAALIGAAGAGIYGATHRKKEKQLSSRSPLIQFASKKARAAKIIKQEIEDATTRAAKKIERRGQILHKGGLSDEAARERSIQNPGDKWTATEHNPKPAWAREEGHAAQNVDELQKSYRQTRAAYQGKTRTTLGGPTALGFRQLKSSQSKVREQLGRGERAVSALNALKAAPKGEKLTNALLALHGTNIKGGDAIARDLDIAAANKDHGRFNELADWARQNKVPVHSTLEKHRVMALGKLRMASSVARAHVAGQESGAILKNDIQASQEHVRALTDKIGDMRAAGEDFPARLEKEKTASYTEGQRGLKGKLEEARGHWQGEIKRNTERTQAEAGAKIKRIQNSTNRKIAIGTGAGATAGAVGGYEAGKEKKKERRFGVIDRTRNGVIRFDAIDNLKRKLGHQQDGGISAHDVAIGGIEGGLGVLATDHLIKRLAPEGSRLWRKLAIGGGVGAIATGAVGYGLNQAVKSRKKQPVQTELSAILFAAPANRTAVTKDRYTKKIHEDDMTRAENNYVRTAIGGGAIASLLRKTTGLGLRNSALAGAGAGILAQALVRHQTAGTKDQFGDRAYYAKRVDNVPGQAALLGAGALGAHGLIRSIMPKAERIGRAGKKIGKAARFVGLQSKSPIIQFDSEDEYGLIKRPRRSAEAVAIDRYGTYAKRGSRLVRDIHAKATGQKVLDARGREKRKEWDRPWVRTALKGAIISGTAVTAAGILHAGKGTAVNSAVREGIEHIQSGRAKQAAKTLAIKHIPLVARIAKKLTKDKTNIAEEAVSIAERSSLLGRANKIIRENSGIPVEEAIKTRLKGGSYAIHPKGSENYNRIQRSKMSEAEKLKADAEKSAASSIERHAHEEPPLKITDWFKKKKNPEQLSALLDDLIQFGQEDYEPRTDGDLLKVAQIRRRIRRGKKIHEKEENKRVIRTAIGGGLVLGGTALGTILGHRSPEAILAEAEKIKKVASSRIFGSLDPLITLNAQLDFALALVGPR